MQDSMTIHLSDGRNKEIELPKYGEIKLIIRKTDVVDHITELRDDWSKRLDDSNFMSLCHRHHNAKTREERRKRSTHKV